MRPSSAPSLLNRSRVRAFTGAPCVLLVVVHPVTFGVDKFQTPVLIVLGHYVSAPTHLQAVHIVASLCCTSPPTPGDKIILGMCRIVCQIGHPSHTHFHSRSRRSHAHQIFFQHLLLRTCYNHVTTHHAATLVPPTSPLSSLIVIPGVAIHPSTCRRLLSAYSKRLPSPMLIHCSVASRWSGLQQALIPQT